MKSTAPLTKAQSAHENVLSRRHRDDKKKNEAFRDSEWIKDEVPGTHESPPGLDGPWSRTRQGVSYHYLGKGMIVEEDPHTFHKFREEFRAKYPKYRQACVRKSRKGELRESSTLRRLRNPVAGFRITLPPWHVRMLKLQPEHEQRRVLKACWSAAAEEVEKAGFECLGLDAHEDTPQPHATLSVLRVDRKTLRLRDMPCASKWTCCMERLRRYGIEPENRQKREWLDGNLARHGITPDILAHRAADAVLDAWVEKQKKPDLEKQFLEEYTRWQGKREGKSAMRKGIKWLRVAEKATGQFFITAAMLKVAEMVKEPSKQKERERKEMDKIIEEANSIR
jgi:hypothetical protein